MGITVFFKGETKMNDKIARQEVAKLAGVSLTKLILALNELNAPEPIEITGIKRKLFYDRQKMMSWLKNNSIKKMRFSNYEERKHKDGLIEERPISRELDRGYFNKTACAFLIKRTTELKECIK